LIYTMAPAPDPTGSIQHSPWPPSCIWGTYF